MFTVEDQQTFASRGVTEAQVMEQMAATNPEVKTLIDKLGLEPTQNK